MNNDINLLHSKKRSVLSDLTTKLRLLRFGALLVLSLVVLLSVALFFLVIASPLPSLKDDEGELLSSLSSRNEVIAKHTLLTARLTDSRSIISKRINMKDTVTFFRTNLPENVEISGLEIEENVVKLRAQSLSLDSLESYLGTLEASVENKEILQTVHMDSITLSDKGYQLNVTALLL